MSLVNFCRFWSMTPRQVDELTPAEYDEMTRYAVRVQAEERRSARRRGKKG